MTSPLPTSFISIEAESAEVIHARMLDQAKQYDGDTDTQEGSPVWDATKPGADEIADVQRMIVDSVYAAIPSTSWGEFLDELVKEVGITRKPGQLATGTIKLQSNVDITVPAGTVISTEADVRFTLNTDAVITPPAEQPDPDNPIPGETTVSVTAEDVGLVYNVSAFTLTRLPREFQNLVTIRQEVAMTGGLDAESDTELKSRYFQRLQNVSGGGNRQDYVNWALEIEQVSAAKVFPTDPSPGSVTVLIWTKTGEPDVSVLDATQAHIDEKASLIATNLIQAPTSRPIDITGTLSVIEGYEAAEVIAAYETQVNAYLNSVVFTANPVRYTELLKILLDTDGVLDVTDFLVNGGLNNIVPATKEAPVLGSVTL